VQVGSITGAKLSNGLALVTLTLQRHQVPHVYANANAALDPITPLGDVQINLSPGAPPSRPLPVGATLGVGQTASPVQLEDLLSNLDTDTRTWLSSLVASLGQGTGGQAANIRGALVTLGPSARQVKEITAALAKRRRELAELVHNLAVVTRAASRDGQLPRLVVAGDQTLQALAAQGVPLRQSISQLPATLQRTEATLVDLRAFAGQLGPTLTSLLPAVHRLPATFDSLRPFARTAATALAQNVRPFVVEAQPLVKRLSPAVTHLSTVTPFLTNAFQVVNYFVNELAYVRGGKDQGYLYWLDWFVHNFNSLAGTGDAHGSLFRADVLFNCKELANMVQLGSLLETALGANTVC
jgi:phospholipid/cholesterol/gamma-HCH transport system substrate-binding protein